MPYLELEPGRSIFFTDEGEGRPVLYLHGWTCDGADWVWLAADLAPGYRNVIPDHRGHGRSTPVPGPTAAKDFAADAAALADHLGLGPSIVVGHSMGGAVAVALAAERPDLVAALVVVDPAYGAEEELLAAAADGVRNGDPHEFAVGGFGGFYGPQTPAWLRGWHRRRVYGTDPAVIRDAGLGAYEGEDAMGRRIVAERYLARRRAPLLAVYGGPGQLAEWARSLTREENDVVEVWPEHGHFLHQEAPERFAARVRTWLDDIGLGPAT